MILSNKSGRVADLRRKWTKANKMGRELLRVISADEYHDAMNIRRGIENLMAKFQWKLKQDSHMFVCDLDHLMRMYDKFVISRDIRDLGINPYRTYSLKEVQDSQPSDYWMEMMVLRTLYEELSSLERELNHSEFQSNFNQALHVLKKLSDPNKKEKHLNGNSKMTKKLVSVLKPPGKGRGGQTHNKHVQWKLTMSQEQVVCEQERRQQWRQQVMHPVPRTICHRRNHPIQTLDNLDSWEWLESDIDVLTDTDNEQSHDSAHSGFRSDFDEAITVLTELSDPANHLKKATDSVIDSVPNIIAAVQFGDIDRVKMVIQNVGDLDERKIQKEDKQDWYGESALMIAVRQINVQIVRELLLNQADPMLRSYVGAGKTMSAQQVAREVWLKCADDSQNMSEINTIINMVRRVHALWRKCNPHYIESANAALPRKMKQKPSRFDLSMTLSLCK